MRTRALVLRDLGLALIAGILSSCASNSVYEPQADREGIRQVVTSHNRELGKCYEDAIDAHPGIRGKVVLAWDIVNEGRVENIMVKSADPGMEAVTPCLVERVKTWRFPAPTGGDVVAVSYPWFFSENGDYRSNKAQPEAAK